MRKLLTSQFSEESAAKLLTQQLETIRLPPALEVLALLAVPVGTGLSSAAFASMQSTAK